MEMNSKDVRSWGERMESGLAGEPTLELANELRSRRPVAVVPSASFVEGLREHLLTLATRRQRHPLVRLAPAILIAGISILLAVLLIPARPASAAEVFERANQHYANLAQEKGILHTEFTLAYTELDIIDQSVIREHEWDGELWQDLTGPNFRRRLTDGEGVIHYFAQRRGDRFWRSAYPVLASRGDLIYVMTEEQFHTPDVPEWRGIAPIFGTLIDWLRLDSWWLADATDCGNPFCAIGLEDNDVWTCEQDRCVFPRLSTNGDTSDAGVRVILIGQQQLPDGRTVHVMEIRVGLGDHLVRTLKFDSTTHELVELIAYQMDVEMARMTVRSREILDPDRGSPFTALPEQLREVVWEGEGPPPAPRLAYAEFPGAPSGVPRRQVLIPVFALPAEGTTVRAGSDLVLLLEVNGTLHEDVDLSAELCGAQPPPPPAPYDFSGCGGLAGARTKVEKGSGTARIAIPIEPDESWPDTVWVYFRWSYADGDYGGSLDPDYFWRVER